MKNEIPIAIGSEKYLCDLCVAVYSACPNCKAGGRSLREMYYGKISSNHTQSPSSPSERMFIRAGLSDLWRMRSITDKC